MTTLAILGGGQLGWMLGLAARDLGVEVRFLDPSPEATAARVGPLTTAPLHGIGPILAFAAGADAVTYEWEGVPAATVRALLGAGHAVHPGVDPLETSQDRLVEKARLVALGIPVAPHAPVDDLASLRAAVGAVGLPAILKTRRGGYDGKGQVVLRAEDGIEAAHAELADAGPLVLEGFVPFDREVSVIAVRSARGEVRTWPLVTNEHRDGILRRSRVVGDDPALEALAVDHVTRLVGDLDHVGVLTLEMFVVGDRLVANEFAPRVHNSGHWTIEGAATSQFANHVRAVLDLPLGPTEVVGTAAMVNCIGRLPTPAVVAGIEGATLHDYAKAPRRGRKVGHITVAAPDAATLDRRVAALLAALPGDDG
ncbi:MAG: 5-(carboxyamino)imidazole ribonucleotide synthase [Actinomycetes bacterium]